jgi:hypothetical protein
MDISNESGLSYQHATNVGFFVANLYIAKNFKPVSKLSRCWGVGSAKNAIRAANCVAGYYRAWFGEAQAVFVSGLPAARSDCARTTHWRGAVVFAA